jgi:hypothetical protein
MYGTTVHRDSPLRNCVAIGDTDSGEDDWGGDIGKVKLESVGIPTYPGLAYPRAVGFARRRDERNRPLPTAKEVRGNALNARILGRTLLVHVVNDKARSWGAGFGKQVAVKYPEAARRFRLAMESASRPRLGDNFSTKVSDQLTIVQLVAQSGYGESDSSRLRYVALQECLRQLREFAKAFGAVVHMPRIGTGFGGAPWAFVKELIEQELVRHEIDVVVYRLSDDRSSPLKQRNLF